MAIEFHKEPSKDLRNVPYRVLWTKYLSVKAVSYTHLDVYKRQEHAFVDSATFQPINLKKKQPMVWRQLEKALEKESNDAKVK